MDAFTLSQRIVTWLAAGGALLSSLTATKVQAQANYTYPYAVTTLAGSATSSSGAVFANPTGIVGDAAGNIYVADKGSNAIRKVSPTGVVSIVAGAAGLQGAADGNVTTATFNQPSGVAVDPAGNIYVADTGNSEIRMIAVGGTVSTIAGGASTVQDGTGPLAGFSYPAGITYYGGNLYVADSNANLIRKVTVAGVVTTIAGGGSLAGSDGTGVAASFSVPIAIVADAGGDLYVADEGNREVRKVELNGVVTTVGGSGGDYVKSVTVDGSGNVYFALAAEVREILVGGTVATVAGSTTSGSNNGLGPAAHFNSILGLAVDGSGNVFVSDAGNNQLREISPGDAVTTFAGAEASNGSQDGVGSAARFNLPVGVAVDASGNVYVVDSSNETIRKIAPGGQVTTLAGSPFVVGSADGTGSAASFNFRGYSSFPAVDAGGNLYVADINNDTIRQITPAGTVTTLAGSAGTPGHADGQGSAAQFISPLGVAVDPSGNLFVTDEGNSTIRKITASGAVTTFAGQAGVNGHADGTGTAATFWSLGGIVSDRSGNLFVCDLPFIRKISPQGIVTTVAGSLPGYADVDGVGSAASFSAPEGLAVDGNDNLFVADLNNNNIRLIDFSGEVSTVAGASAAPGFSGGATGSADGAGVAARFLGPMGIAADAAGTIYVADSGNNTIRKGTPTVALPAPAAVPTPTPTPGQGSTPTPPPSAVPNQPPYITAQPLGQTADVGSATAFWVGAAGSAPLSYQWSFNGSAIPGAISALYELADVQAGSAGTFSVTVSNSLGQVTSAAAKLTVQAPGTGAPPILGTPPASQTIASGGTVVFTAQLGSGDSATAVPIPGAAMTRISSATTYQWFFDGTPVGEANDSTYVISPATAANDGTYTCLIANADGVVLTAPASLSVLTTTDPGRLVNISCRADAGTGSSTLITGFVLAGGNASATEQLLVRGSGPALVPFGVSGTLNDPELKLFQGEPSGSSALLGMNDAWAGNALAAATATSVGAFPWSVASSHDTALVVDLAAGTYTAQIAGESGDSGVALAEVYDAPAAGSPRSSAPKLINISARVQVGTSANILITGFVIGGSTSASVLVRAAGPALKAFSVTGTLPDPKLQLYRANTDGSSTLVAANTGWGGDSQIYASAAAVGAFSWGSSATADSALLATLPPGAYTAQVSGASGDTGVALVEVYLVP